MATHLSPHFTLEELTTTEQHGLDNTPGPEEIANLAHTAWPMEIVRHTLDDHALHVNSAYRSKAVNKAVGGSGTSDHCNGHAVDFICPEFGSPFDIANTIAESGLKFDQLIYEGTWVHISFAPAMRGDVMTAHFKPGRPTTYTRGIQPQ